MILIRILCLALLFNIGDGFASAQQSPEKPGAQEAESAAEDNSPAPVEEPEPNGAKPGEVPDSEKNSKAEKQGDTKNDEAESSDESSADSESESTRKTRRGRISYSKRSKQFTNVFSPVVASTSASVVEISDGKRRIALGTIIDPEGLILTKASELKAGLECKLADGTTLEPTIVGIDPDTDLVLLKVAAKGLNFARIEDEIQPAVGAWLATVGQDDIPLAVGIVSHQAREIADVTLNSAVIGIYPEDREEGDGVRINVVLNDTPAEQAGLLVNDVIVAIDDKKILNRSELMETLARLHPGDEIVLKISRGEEQLEVPVTLGKRTVNPMMDRGNRQNQMGSTLSKRRSDFPLALQHDSSLNANEIGGPVVDLNGRVIGINIARDGRVSSLALPNEIVIPIIAKLRTGKYQPAVVNRSEIRLLEKQLAKLEIELGDLPAQKTEKEIEFSAGAAVEKEIALQVKQVEEQLAALQARLNEIKTANKSLIKSIAEIDDKRKRIDRKREPPEQIGRAAGREKV